MLVPLVHAAELAVSDADGRIEFHNEASLGAFDGRARSFAGSLDTDAVTGELVIVASSLATGLGPRDSRLLTWCLEVARFPEIRFALTGGGPLAAGSGATTLRGQLTVRDVTLPVEIPTTWTWEGDTLHLKGRYDMDWSAWSVPDPSIVLSKLEPGMSVSFDVLARPR